MINVHITPRSSLVSKLHSVIQNAHLTKWHKSTTVSSETQETKNKEGSVPDVHSTKRLCPLVSCTLIGCKCRWFSSPESLQNSKDDHFYQIVANALTLRRQWYYCTSCWFLSSISVTKDDMWVRCCWLWKWHIVCLFFNRASLVFRNTFPFPSLARVQVAERIFREWESNCGHNIRQFSGPEAPSSHYKTAGRVSGLFMMMDCPQGNRRGEKIGTTFVSIVCFLVGD